jgi:hypothetical protein
VCVQTLQVQLHTAVPAKTKTAPAAALTFSNRYRLDVPCDNLPTQRLLDALLFNRKSLVLNKTSSIIHESLMIKRLQKLTVHAVGMTSRVRCREKRAMSNWGSSTPASFGKPCAPQADRVAG